jgi:predicted solute-binding protein
MHSKKSRKEVLEAFVENVGLTPSSASTYYQKFLTAAEGNGGKATKRASGSSGRGRRPDEGSKAGICRAIFKKLAKKPRKDVLSAFMEDAGLTPAGASTYYQKLKHAA